MSAILTSNNLAAVVVRDAVETAYPFEIVKLPLGGPDGLTTPHFGLFKNTAGVLGDSVGNACRAGYTPHTRDDVRVLGEIAAAVFDSATTKITCAWKEGHQLTIGPTDSTRAAIFGGADAIFPRFIIRAGYDGRSFSAGLGLYRDACENLQMITTAGASHFVRIRHTHALRERMPEIVDQFRELAAGWDNVQAIVQAMRSRRVVLADYLAQVYPAAENDSKRTTNAAGRRISAIISRISRERVKLGAGLGDLREATAWESFNGVQGYVQHEKARRGRPSRLDRAWLALDDVDVAKALSLATAA